MTEETVEEQQISEHDTHSRADGVLARYLIQQFEGIGVIKFDMWTGKAWILFSHPHFEWQHIREA